MKNNIVQIISVLMLTTILFGTTSQPEFASASGQAATAAALAREAGLIL